MNLCNRGVFNKLRRRFSFNLSVSTQKLWIVWLLFTVILVYWRKFFPSCWVHSSSARAPPRVLPSLHNFWREVMVVIFVLFLHQSVILYFWLRGALSLSSVPDWPWCHLTISSPALSICLDCLSVFGRCQSRGHPTLAVVCPFLPFSAF